MFESVTFTNSAVGDCDKLKGTQTINNNVLSVLVESDCGLSTGTLIGIIVGSVIGGIGIAVVLLILWRRQRNQFDKESNQMIKERELREMKRMAMNQ